MLDTVDLTDDVAALTATLTAIVNGRKHSRIDGLLLWNYPAISAVGAMRS